MNIEILADIKDRDLLLIYDVSPKGQNIPSEIFSYTLDIAGSRMPNGKLLYSLDVIQYLNSSMIQDEIYKLTSGDLGFQENIDIPDGIYKIYCTINNIYRKELKILVYQNVKTKVNELLKAADYKVNVTSNTMKYVKDKVNSKYDIEEIRYAKTLMDKMEEYVTLDDEIEVIDTLDKLERLLGILKN